MNSQQFFLVNIVILAVFVVWFLAGRRSARNRPTSLDMKKGHRVEGGVLQTNSESDRNLSETTGGGRYSHPKYQKFLESEKQKAGASKELNVLFNYNGHTWDAYEVFGLPAGSNLAEVTMAYQKMLKTSDPESHEFLETAFKAILIKQ